MTKLFKKIPEELNTFILNMRQITRRRNLSVYFVGGFVRDLILGVKNLDLDIVVEGDGIKFANDFASLFMGKVTEHKNFGTATFVLNKFLKIDFSSARREIYPKPAQLPIVSPSSLRDDLLRRDFTINAMAISLSTGRLIDYFGGLNDLRLKKIRVLHPLSFIDDPTRILRAIRFEQRYGLKIEHKTLMLLKEALDLKMLEKLHPHRLRDDLIIILKENNPDRVLKRIQKLAGFKFIHPALKVPAKTFSLFKSIKKEINWFKAGCFERRSMDYWIIYLMALLDSLDLNCVKRVCEKLGLRKGETKRILAYKQISKKSISDLSSSSLKPSRIFAILEPLSYEVILMLKVKYSNRNLKRHILEFLEIYNGMRVFVSGDDLHGMGLKPGPSYQKIFAQVLNAKLNTKVRTKEEELVLIKSLVKKRS